MTTQETIEVPAREVKPGDMLHWKGVWDEVVSKACKVKRVHITCRDHNAVETDAIKIVRPLEDDIVTVSRAVPTAEELAAKAAELEALQLQRLTDKLLAAPHEAQAIRTEAKNTIDKYGLLEAMSRGYDLVAREAAALQVAEWTATWIFNKNARDHYTGDLAQYIVDSADTLAERLLSQGADDSWSGRGNEARRARFDGLRELVSDRHGFGTTVLSTARLIIADRTK